MTKQVLYIVLPESAPVSSLSHVQTYVSNSFLTATKQAIFFSEYSENQHPEQALHHHAYRIYECEVDSRRRVVGYTAKTSDGWIVALF